MRHSDKDLMVSTQISYYDVILGKDVNGNDIPKEIGKVISEDRKNNTGTYSRIVDEMNKAAKDQGVNSLEYKRYSETKKMYSFIRFCLKLFK